MKCTLSRLSCIFLLLIWSSISIAKSYSIEYAAKSPIKEINLKNVELNLEMYAYDKPDGYKSVTTDQNQSFTLEQGKVFEIISIKGEEKYKALCAGSATPETNKIEINCVPKQ